MKTASTTNSSINATSTSSKRLSGLLSGLDTDTLVQQLSSGTQSKIDKQMQSKQIAQWRQQSYRQATTALTEFKNKYFSSSSSSSNISSPSFFNATAIKNTSPFLNISGNASVAKNMVITNISHLAKQASFSSSHKVSNQTITTGVISDVFAKSKVSNASMTINYGGKDYAVSLSSDFTFDSTDGAANITALAKELNTQISKIDGLKGHVSFGEGDGKIALTGTDTATIKDGNENLLKGLGLTKESTYSSTAPSGATDAASLFTTAVLADTLSGSTVSFSLNGVSKNITFDESRKGEYSTPELLAGYLNGKLKTAFGVNSEGKNNVSVVNNSSKLSFTTADSTSILSISSSDKSGILGIDGALRTYAGETNRINTNKTLEDIQSNLSTRLDNPDSYAPAKTTGDFDAYAPPKTTGDFNAYAPAKTTGDFDAYGLTINGKKFAFKSTDTISSILTAVNNDSDANVTMSYSNTTNTFSVAAKNGGASGKIDIADSTLANTLFGKSATLSYDFTGNDKTILAGKTIKVGDTTFEFLNGGSATGTNIGIDISATIDAAGIANKFNECAKDNGYTVSVTDSKVTLTATSGSTPSGDIIGTLVGGDYTVQDGVNAELSVSFDGDPAHVVNIVRGDNKFTLDGVNFELLGTTDPTVVTADKPIKFTADNKTDELFTKIKSFVDDYNALIELANSKVSERKEKGSFAPLTDVQRKDMSETEITAWETKAKKGLLQGDSILNMLSLNLRNSMTDQVASMKSALYQIGIASKANDYSANGKLTINEELLKKSLNDDPEKISSMFTGTDGIATRMQSVIDKNIKTTGGDGILIAKAGVENSSVDRSTITDSITVYDRKIKELQTLMKTQQDHYYSKFTKLEQYLSKMNSQASFFTSNTSS